MTAKKPRPQPIEVWVVVNSTGKPMILGVGTGASPAAFWAHGAARAWAGDMTQFAPRVVRYTLRPARKAKR